VKILEDLDLGRPGPGPLEPLLPTLALPTLILWGAHDQLIDVSAAGVFSAAIRGSEITVFADCGHALPRECGEPLARRYLAFLEAVQGARAPH
jgi:pimeloyl-ACP methyl ester carboxylesterase